MSNYISDESPQHIYSRHLQKLEAKYNMLRQKRRNLLFFKIGSFLLFLGSLAYYALSATEVVVLVVALLFLMGYFVVYRLDVVNEHQMTMIRRRTNVYRREINYLAGNLSGLDEGLDFADAHHAFTFDLDIFGAASLFQRICRTVTTGGRRILAQMLQTPLTQISDITTRSKAIEELCQKEEWRNEFVSLTESIDSANVKQVFAQLKVQKSGFSSVFTLLIVILSVTTEFILIVLATCQMVSSMLPLYGLFIQFGVVTMVTAKRMAQLTRVLVPIHKLLKANVILLAHLEKQHFDTSLNRELYQQLFTKEVNALKAFRQLSAILNSVDRRANLLGLFVCNGLFCNDVLIVRRMEKWTNTSVAHLAKWIEAIDKFDALISMANYCFNHPETHEPEIEESNEIIYSATGLYHPFLNREKAVVNDFEITDRRIYIVTGANMAGKSTFLRALGVNYLLATVGLPVFATSLRVSLFSLFSSMRTSDNLSEGISYFNAELLRLKQLIAYCKENPPTLIILDEILKGTNSADKLNGSRLFLDAITRLPVSGVIATHDLALSELANHDEQRFTNFCFEIELTANIRYTYKISPGVAKNMNATYLLQNIIAEIVAT